MRLSQLQIKGFKSFAEDTVINFNEQVIGIVGPNGSGKSNIIDAIKWVLGEQKTKELRLETMQDVLFNGTNERKEGKVAKVSVHFKNTRNILPTEYNDVSITRILYRNGQSEYRLNDVQCRKKDITSLFLDSGLGSNSYAIISLSMVEDILVDKDNSRGRMIEEASGINKYKVRKKETLNKLKGTQTDLDRIEDLLFELESNLKAFEKQARRTERYLKVKNEFREISLSWASINTRKIRSDLKELKQRLNDEISRESEITTLLNTKEAELQTIKKDILEKEGLLSKFQRSHNDLKTRIQAIENKKGIAQNEQKYLESSIQNLELEQNKISIEINNLKIDHSSKADEKNKEEAFISDIENIWNEKNQEYQALKEVYDVLRSNLVSGQSAKQRISQELDHTIREISAKQSQITLLKEQTDVRQEESNDLTKILKGKSENLELLEAEANKIEKSALERREQLKELKDQAVEIQNPIRAKEERLKKLDLQSARIGQRIELLTNVIENYEGFSQSVQFLNNEQQLHHPVVTDIIEIKDQKYKDILEMYFFPILQHLVVDDIQEAGNLNTLVRDAQKGKVNFIIREDIPQTVSSQEHPSLVPIIDLIDFENSYRSVIEFLSQNVFVYEGDFDSIESLNLTDDTTILLPGEQLIYRKGELKGGSISLFEGVNIGRRQNLTELKKKQVQLDLESEELLAALSEKRQHQLALTSKISDLTEKVGISDRSLIEIKERLYEKASEIRFKRSRLEEMSETVVAAKKHIAQIELEIGKLKKMEESFAMQNVDEAELSKMRADFDKYHIEFEQVRDERDEVNQTLVHSRNNLNFTIRDISVIDDALHQKQESYQNNTDRKEADTKRQSKLKSDIDQLEQEVIALYENEKKQFAELNNHEEQYFQAKSGIYDKEKNIYEIRGKRDKLHQLISGIKEKISERNQQLTSINDRAEVEFNVNIEKYEIADEYSGIALVDLSERRDSLSNRLRGFGDINPLAIEAYNEIKIRVEKISVERDDILAAKLNLEETINDIEQKASQLFTEALDKIRYHFKEVFRSLFSEDDTCDIVLLNADNPLESSIEIMAKPKGKKPKSINQLSGGEKTLTAVSFLFALYLLKPAPFCIFDEVDAPLDDVNIQKFNNIIRTFSKESQFIIVTHNKATMAEMDILYGVFMREKGISGVAAVDFRNFKKIDLFSEIGSNAN